LKSRKDYVSQQITAHSAAAAVAEEDRLSGCNRNGAIQGRIEFGFGRH
jgi:hypothetical protein